MKTLIHCETYTAPDCWAPALINGDYSGLSESESKACRAWAESLPGDIVACDGEPFLTRWHDATAQSPYAAMCCTYTTHEHKES